MPKQGNMTFQGKYKTIKGEEEESLDNKLTDFFIGGCSAFLYSQKIISGNYRN